MEYNYYPAQSGHPPPPLNNPQHGGPQMQQQPPPGGQMMHAPMPPQNIRQAMPPGPPNHHQQQMQQMQQQQHIGHHPQQMPPQQQHPNYQIQAPHPHGPPVSHSGSPHPQQHHNHQPSLSGPPPQQSPIPGQQHHMHPQSPHHHGGPPMHIQQQQQQQQLNQMVRPPLGPSVMNHPQPGMQQHPHHQNFFSGGPIPQTNLHHYPQQNQHHPQHHHQQHHHQPPMMHHAPSMFNHHVHIQQGIGRNSPYYPSILQTEFRIIELNRRLQCRPIPRHPISPLPNHPYDESLWWERFASDFFEDDATLTLRSIQDDKPLEYTIGRTLIPRFFRTYFDGGVTDLSINLRNPKEACLNPNLITLDCDQAFIVTNNIFKHPAIPSNHSVVVHTEGHLILDFVSNNYDTLSIKSWKFFTRSCREYIDRSMTAMGLPNTLLVDPLTRQQGLTKSTISYLKMCMIMEPMQDMMFQHKTSKQDPRVCLRRYLIEKYKYKPTDEIRAVVVTNKRRKRKPSAVPNIPGAPTTVTNKKSKTSINNPMGGNSGLNNNTMMMSPSGGPTTFTLASQDVMVVGEPSMMGGDFGDDNERMITRLENTQYDPSASTPSNTEESDSMNISAGNDNGLSNNIDLNLENHTMSPSLLQQRQQQPQQMQTMQQQDQIEHHSPQEDSLEAHQSQRIPLNIQDQPHEEATPVQNNLIEQSEEMNQQASIEQMENNSSELLAEENVMQDGNLVQDQQQQQLPAPIQHEVGGDVKINSIVDATSDQNLILGVNSVEQLENHTNSIQPINDESNSNSQLACSTAPATSAIEQQQPVDNGVA